MKILQKTVSLLLVCCMVLGCAPQVFAEGEGHIHDAECGYVPAAAEQPCNHECGEECAEGCIHTEHDADCGYAPAVEEQPCTYVQPDSENSPSEDGDTEKGENPDTNPDSGNSPNPDDPSDDNVNTGEGNDPDSGITPDPENPDQNPEGEEAEELALDDDESLAAAQLQASIDALTPRDQLGELPEEELEVLLQTVEELRHMLETQKEALGEDYQALSDALAPYENGIFEYVVRSYDVAAEAVKSVTKTVVDPVPVTAATTKLEGTQFYVVTGEVTVPNRVEVIGDDVKLLLADGCSVNFQNGIDLDNYNTLTIYGQKADSGKLIARGPENHAGIGSGNTPRAHFGVLNIHGGNFTVHSGNHAAAIGTGAGPCDGWGTFNMYGGRVETNPDITHKVPTRHYGGAGIGGGVGSPGFTTTIYGGTVIARGGEYAANRYINNPDTKGGAGIGGGYGGSGGETTIYGGTVRAYSGAGGAGIGSGGFTTESGGKITIRGGDVEARAQTYRGFLMNDLEGGSGIGGGWQSSGGTIEIKGGTVKAWGGNDFPGIGSGTDKSSYSVTITGGNVYAEGDRYAAGIGGGLDGGSGTTTISGGTVTAKSIFGAGIGGSGARGGGDAGTITISGGNVTADTKFYGAAIGTNDVFANNRAIVGGRVNITGGTVHATSASVFADYAAIGAGSGAKNVTVNISGGTVYAKSVAVTTYAGDIYDGEEKLATYDPEAGTLTFTDGNVVNVPESDANGATYWGPGIGGSTGAVGTKINISGGAVTAEGKDAMANAEFTLSGDVVMGYGPNPQDIHGKLKAGDQNIQEILKGMPYASTEVHLHDWQLTPTDNSLKITCSGTKGACPYAPGFTLKVEADDADYNNAHHLASVIGDVGAFLAVYSADVSPITYLLNGVRQDVKPVNAGAWTAQATVSIEGKSQTISKEYTIRKVAPGVQQLPAAKHVNYNGQEQELLTAGKAEFADFLYSKDGKTWNAEIPTAKEMGEYTVYYRAEATDGNHLDIEAASITVTIGKSQPEFTAPKANALVYDGEVHELLTPGQTTQGTFWYSVDGQNWSTEIPKGKDPVTNVQWYIKADESHGDTEPATITVKMGIPYRNMRNPQDPTTWVDLICTDYTLVTSDIKIIYAYKWYVVYGDVTLSGRPEVGGVEARLILMDGSTLTAPKGIDIGRDDDLTIYGQTNNSGTLRATGVSLNPALGGDGSYDRGGLTIVGGNILATGYRGVDCDYVGIIGGNLTAIGTGGSCGMFGDMNEATLQIYGGNLKAMGSSAIGVENWPVTISLYNGVKLEVKRDDDALSRWDQYFPTNPSTNPSNNRYARTMTNRGIAKFTTKPVGKNLICNGENQALVEPGITQEGIIQYSLDGEKWGEAVPVADKAGTYTVHFRIIGDAAHDDSNKDSVTTQVYPSLDMKGVTLLLNGKIGIKFHVTAAQGLEDLGLSFKVDDSIIPFTDCKWELEPDTNSRVYEVVSEKAAAQMTEQVKLSVLDAQGNRVGLTQKGAAVQDNTVLYTVKDWCDASTSEKDIALSNAMLNYGCWAQQYFGVHLDAPAADGSYDMSSVTPESLDAYKAVTSGKVDGLTYAGSSLVLNADTSMYVFFTVTGSKDDYTVTVDGQPAQWLVRGDMVYVAVRNMAAPRLSDSHTVTVTRGRQTYSRTCSAFTYVQTVLAEETKDEILCKTMQALVCYWKAAKTYFGV